MTDLNTGKSCVATAVSLPEREGNRADRADVLATCGLHESPFADRPGENIGDAFFFPSQQHLRALGFIGQLLWSRATLAMITSEPGMGKSLLIERLLSDLDERVLIAHVQVSAEMEAQDFLLSVLQQFGMNLDAADRGDRRRLLARFLSHQYNQNRLCLLVVEGMQVLKPLVLEELRLIGELAIEGRRIVKLLLLGAPSLHHVIDSPRMVGLTDGRAPRLSIDGFSEDQVAAYVAHRLRAAGSFDADQLIPPTLMTAIHRFTAGRPRLINRLCDAALASAVAVGEVRVTEVALKTAASNLLLCPVMSDGSSAESRSSLANGDLPPLDQAILVITVQGGTDGVVPLHASRILIGRGESADVRIDSAFISRYHALIVRETGEGADEHTARDVLIDLGSTNGMLINGKRIVRHTLKHRDLIQVGHARITYLNPSLAPPIERDSSETVSFGRAGVTDESADQALLAFGRFNEAS